MAVKYDLDTLRGDFFGGLTSMVVALPVSLGFGIASGMGAAAGLYGAIAVGFFAAVFGGTRSQISGPTAPMAVAMAVVLTTHADTLPEALTVVLLAGLLQVLLGLSRIGRFVAYTPHVVVSGFMSGIGVIVIVLQIMPFLGADSASGGVIGALRALPDALSNANTSALAIAVVTLVVGFLWPRRLSRYAPGPLVALITGTLLGVLWLSDAPVIGEIPTGLPGLVWEMPAAGFLVTALQPALILALLGSVDSLLTSLVADSLTGQRHNPDRELIGQGIGNMVAGLFGALPGAGATMGTVINIRSGGTTRASGALRALLVLAVVLGLGRFAEPIPLAALAGVLMKVGWDIMDRRLLVRIHRLRSQHLVVMLVTLVLTVSVDLITAVAIGLIAGGLAHARRLERLELDSVFSVALLGRTFFGGVSE
ncbi:MAG: SulP family inorganic anion transporter, partial [bacterium]|nr:SulP family inorganic anion transporter [bacterium]